MRGLPSVTLLLLTVSLLVSLAKPVQADTRSENPDKTARSEAVIKPDRPVDIAVSGGAPDYVQQVIELTNRERLSAGLPALKREQRLQQSAEWLARDMSEHGNFDHRDSSHREMPARLLDFKYSGYHAVGENIAMGQRTPEEVVRGWMRSPGHRANILSMQFSEIGVGYVPPGQHNGYGYWVQDFGSRFEACPIVINSDSVATSSPHVKLSVHGSDWAEQARFSNDGLNWTAWEAFRFIREWDLDPGTGKRTVFVEIRRGRRTVRLEAVIQVAEPQRVAAADR